ncbi:MAG: glycine/sarcosine/betaine reductase selenoprotein B family protein [Chloroflexota bacterium]|nr:glycine/sarcosine/betaine reductase selenoprotein B family protein [Chloroflexota bacterium]
MPRLDQLSEIQRQSAVYFPCLENDTVPWVPWTKELSKSKVALVSSAGLHLRSDKPFGPGDPTYRVIPSDSSTADVIDSHTSIGWDRTGIYRDLNLAFPMDRLRELVDRKVIGSLSQDYYSFMGAQRDPRKIIEETGPQAAEALHAQDVDLVFLVPV